MLILASADLGIDLVSCQLSPLCMSYYWADAQTQWKNTVQIGLITSMGCFNIEHEKSAHIHFIYYVLKNWGYIYMSISACIILIQIL